MNRRYAKPVSLVLGTFLFLLIAAGQSTAGGKTGIYGIRMIPYGVDAEQYSSAGWGFGVHAVLPVPGVSNLIAGTGGFEYVNLLDGTETFTDERTGLRVEQQTKQNYYRFYLGAQAGGHGNGFLRPHVGANLALLVYELVADVVVPDDYNREQEIRQKLSDETRVAFGYDLTMGLDLNFSNTIALDGGVRYLKSLRVPQQLGEGSVMIYPQYFQVYLGVGISLDMLEDKGGDNGE